MAAVHQLVAGFTLGDAISNHARSLREVFVSWGYESLIYAMPEFTHPKLKTSEVAGNARALQPGPDDLVVLHLSIGSPVNNIFRDLSCRKAIIYHNVTPAHFFRASDPYLAKQLEAGRTEAASLAGVADVNLAVSAYNASELRDWGYRDVGVLPLLLDLDRLQGDSLCPIHLKAFKEPKTTICFVGRVAPNKCLEDLMCAFHYYIKYVNPNARFVHAGSGGSRLYRNLLECLRHDLQLDDFHMLGRVSEERLRTLFQTADMFLCMSEHEGFCIPLLEAMKAGLPVMAYAAAAVPETMDGAGVLVNEKSNWAAIAHMMDKLARPGSFRDAVIAKQNERLARYEATDLAGLMREQFAGVLPAR